MNRGEFMQSMASDLMYNQEWMEFSEALDKADKIWQNVWGGDVEEVYLEEMGEDE